MSIWDVVAGGGITLAGTIATQGALLFSGRSQRREARRVAFSEYDRKALDDLQRAAKAYRASLVAYNHELESTPAVLQEVERQLQRDRMDYQAFLHRVDPSVTGLLDTWERVAVQWSQQEEGAAKEETAWTAAMRQCGRQLRASFKKI